MAMRTSDWPIVVKQLDGMTVPTIFCFGGSKTITRGLKKTRPNLALADNSTKTPVLSTCWTFWCCCLGLLLSPPVSMCIIWLSAPSWTYKWIWSLQIQFSCANVSDCVHCSSLSGVCACTFCFFWYQRVLSRNVSCTQVFTEREKTTEKRKI